MTKPVTERAHFGVFTTYREAVTELERVKCRSGVVVRLYAARGRGKLGDLLGYTIVPGGHTCFACNQPVEDKHEAHATA